MIQIPGGTMNARLQENIENGNTFGRQALATYNEIEIAFAETMLDEVEEAQAQMLSLKQDIALLETAENALDLITENLAKIYQLVKMHQRDDLTHSEQNELSDRINNLLMVTMLVTEEAEFNGNPLFKNGVIQLNGTGYGRLYLTTAHIPEIKGIDTNDYQAALKSLSAAAHTINRQYQQICHAFRTLQDDYRQLRNEIDILTSARQKLAKD